MEPDVWCAFIWPFACFHVRFAGSSGNVSPDVTTWCADLVNVFEVFLPQLLLYPNPTDPLNGEAAALLMREPETYKKKVRGAPWQLYLPIHFPLPTCCCERLARKRSMHSLLADVMQWRGDPVIQVTGCMVDVHGAAVRADYVGRYAKKGDAMPKHSMGDDSGSEEGSEADEKGFLSSRHVRAQLAGSQCMSARQDAMPLCICKGQQTLHTKQHLCVL